MATGLRVCVINSPWSDRSWTTGSSLGWKVFDGLDGPKSCHVIEKQVQWRVYQEIIWLDTRFIDSWLPSHLKMIEYDEEGGYKAMEIIY